MVQPAVFMPVRQECAEGWTPAFAGVTKGVGRGLYAPALSQVGMFREEPRLAQGVPVALTREDVAQVGGEVKNKILSQESFLLGARVR